MEPAHEHDFIESIKVFHVRIEDEHTGPHDVEHDSPLDVPKTNTTAGHTDKARENDAAAQSDDSHSHDDHEPDGSEYDDEASEEVDGEDEEPA